MFIVTSKWKPKEDQIDAWREATAKTREDLLQFPGVEMMYRYVNDEGDVIVIIGYADKATWSSLVEDPNGAVAQHMAANNIETMADWISSDRGETVD